MSPRHPPAATITYADMASVRTVLRHSVRWWDLPVIAGWTLWVSHARLAWLFRVSPARPSAARWREHCPDTYCTEAELHA